MNMNALSLIRVHSCPFAVDSWVWGCEPAALRIEPICQLLLGESACSHPPEGPLVEALRQSLQEVFAQ